MTKKDESPEEGANPYWSDELLAVLAEALGDEDRARQTLEDIIQQAQEGKACWRSRRTASLDAPPL